MLCVARVRITDGSGRVRTGLSSGYGRRGSTGGATFLTSLLGVLAPATDATDVVIGLFPRHHLFIRERLEAVECRPVRNVGRCRVRKSTRRSCANSLCANCAAGQRGERNSPRGPSCTGHDDFLARKKIALRWRRASLFNCGPDAPCCAQAFCEAHYPG